ncbi:MAG TPA: D-alanyl-D-alanine carboxypeptidase, partial [Thermoanaerobaculia bacterium]
MLRSLLRSFVLLLIIFTALPAEAPGASSAPRRKGRGRRGAMSLPRLPEPRSLEEAFEQALRRAPGREDGLSIEIADLDSGQVLLEKNPQSPQTIASITKMFTTAEALHFLGPDYKFKTTFWRRGEVRDGSLLGSLLVVGGGDPNISGRFYNDDFNAVFDKWAQGLVQAGIRNIVGDLVLNASFFDAQARHPEWPSGQEAKWYQAP